MEGNQRYREFEHFLKENADDSRMFPSERVWKNIHSSLHTRRKWEGYGLLGLLLLVTTAVTWVMITYPVSTTAFQNIPAGNPPVKSEPAQPASSANLTLAPFHSANSPASQPLAVLNNTQNTVTVPVASAVTEDYDNRFTAIHTVPGSSENISAETIANINTPSLTIPSYQTAPDITASSIGIIGLPDETSAPAAVVVQSEENNTEIIPTIESVISSLKTRTKKSFGWQLFVTPTVSYRGLSENKPDNRSFNGFRNIDNIVLHKPDMGLQMGMITSYPIAKWLKLRGGVQFNINKYDIRAYDYSMELARIDLNNTTWGQRDVVTTWTSHRNIGGFKEGWLKNTYFSVSAPVGFELRLIGNDKTNFSIANTIQPTYIIRDKAYLLSTDYKNYAKVPSLTRRFNLNYGVETVVNFTSRGDVKWQVGPQLRYQLLSSFDDKYPVRENLFDFGVKVGVMLKN